MRVTEYSAQKLRESLDVLEDALRMRERKISSLSQKIHGLHKEQEQVEKEFNSLKQDIGYLQKAQVLSRGISSELDAFRKEILEMATRVEGDDITVGKMRELRVLIEKKTKELRERCTHPFIYWHKGFSGSYVYDFTDAYPGRACCAVCGLEEHEKNNSFSILVTAHNRLLENTRGHNFEELQKYFANLPDGAAIVDTFAFIVHPHFHEMVESKLQRERTD